MKEEMQKNKPQGKNIMVCPITQGDHNQQYLEANIVDVCDQMSDVLFKQQMTNNDDTSLAI